MTRLGGRSSPSFLGCWTSARHQKVLKFLLTVPPVVSKLFGTTASISQHTVAVGELRGGSNRRSIHVPVPVHLKVGGSKRQGVLRSCSLIALGAFLSLLHPLLVVSQSRNTFRRGSVLIAHILPSLGLVFPMLLAVI